MAFQRTPLFAIAGSLALVVALEVSGDTQSPGSPPPSLNPPRDAVAITGCIDGTTLVANDGPHTSYETTRLGAVYRLRGSKTLVRQLLKEHDNHVEEVTGIVRVPAVVKPGGGPKQKKLGKGTITVEDRSVARPAEEMRGADLMASLEVVSFRHVSIHCPR